MFYIGPDSKDRYIINLSNVDAIQICENIIAIYFASQNVKFGFENDQQAEAEYQKIVEFLSKRSCVL